MKIKTLGKIFLAVVLFVMLAGKVEAIEYGQMGGKPTNFDPNIPDSKAWFIYNLDPGVSKEDSLTVANLFNESWVAVIYAADSIKSSSGGFALKQLTEPKEAVGSWVKFYPDAKPDFANKLFEEKVTIDEVCKVSTEDLEKKYELDADKIGILAEWCKGKEMVELELKAGEKKELLFVINIPAGAEVGEHTGGILIQKKAKDESAQSDGSKVMLTTRVGVRIYETVPGSIIKKLSFADFALVKNFQEFYLPWDKMKKEKFKEYIISSVINNSGNVSTNFSENIVIKNLITKKEERVDNREFQVLRGDVFTSSLAWKAPRLGYLSFQKEYIYKDAGDNEQKISTEIIKQWFIPWREMVITLLALTLLGAVYYFWARYQKKNFGGIGWIDYEVREGDTVQSLVQSLGLNWKVFIKTNKLKAPYLLTTGQIVKIPKVDSGDFSEDKIVKEEKEIILPASETLELEEDIFAPELTDEDILNKKDLPVTVVNESQEKEMVAADSVAAKDELASNDFVDSSMFFEDEITGGQEVAVKTTVVKEEVAAPIIDQIKRPTVKTQPLKKKAEVLEEVVAAAPAPEESITIEEGTGFPAEDEMLSIQGVSADTQNSKFKWILAILGVLIVGLLAAVVYLLLDKKNSAPVVITAPVVEKVETPASVVSEPQEATVAPEEVKIDPLKLKIEIANGSGVAGAAGKVKDFLVSKQYENVEAKNYSAEDVTGSTIYYSEEKLEKEAKWIADMLKDKKIVAEIKLATKDEEKTGDIVIVLGK